MLTRLLAIFFIICAITYNFAGGVSASYDNGDRDLAERDEIHQSLDIAPGTELLVNDVSGPVDIETTGDAGAATIDIVRSAHTRADLEQRKMEIVREPGRIIVRTIPQHGLHVTWREVRQRVHIRVPRQIALSSNDISGHLTAGDVDGAVHVNDISGAVTIGDVGGTLHVNDVSGSVRVGTIAARCDINDISGSVSLDVTRLAADGIHITDISGAVEIGLADGLDASLSVTDVSGNVGLGIPGMKVLGKINSDSYKATLGSGGAPITINDISGSVSLHPVGSAQ